MLRDTLPASKHEGQKQKIRMADDKRRLLAEQAKQHAQAVAQMQEDFWK
jgi:hypothetical protein